MWGRRIGYMAALLGCLCLYLYFNQWAFWVLMWWLLVLPVFSLCISLPAMRTAQFSVACPQNAAMGQTVTVSLQARCRFPVPAYKCKLRILHCLTGEEFTCVPGERLQTEHCGSQRITVERLRVFDYLGLFSRRIKNPEGCVCTIEPVAVETAIPGRSGEDTAMRPKRGGGFAEEHDLRHYVPGDDLRQIHWKLSAKTGKVVVREPMEQKNATSLLTVVLSGSRSVIDDKLGKLLWLSRTLLEKGQKHEAAVLSGRGLERFVIADKDDLSSMLQRVLCAPQAPADKKMTSFEEGTCCVLIGGDADGS